MSRPIPVALSGLSATEQVLLEGALFSPGSVQLPGAVLVRDLAQAELIIANASDLAAVRALQERALAARVLLLGRSDAGTGWPVVQRPLRLHAVLEAARRLLAPSGESSRLDQLPTGFAATVPFMVQPEPGEDGFEATCQFDATQPLSSVPTRGAVVAPPRRVNHEVPSVVPSDWEEEQAEWKREVAGRSRSVTPQAVVAAAAASDVPVAASPARPVPAQLTGKSAAPVGAEHILVVGLPGTAVSGLLKTLQSSGFAVDVAADRTAVFTQLLQRSYRFVFLIEFSLGTQTIELCSGIRKSSGLSGPALRLVIVASHRGVLSRLRAWLAGCNAWMAIPLDRKKLLHYLRSAAP